LASEGKWGKQHLGNKVGAVRPKVGQIGTILNYSTRSKIPEIVRMSKEE
jgi:hypothetical protein